MITNYTVILTPPNKTLWLNAIAFLAKAPGFRTDPPDLSSEVTYQGPPGDYSIITLKTDGTYERRMKDGTLYRFNADGYQTSVEDRNNNQTVYTHDGQNRLTTITDPLGQLTTLGYNGNWLSSITDPANRVTQFTHDSDGNLTDITYADNAVEQFAYDANHRITSRTDARNKVTQYRYNSFGRLEETTLSTGDTRRLVPYQLAGLPDAANGEGTAGNPATLAQPVNEATFTDGRQNPTMFELDSNSFLTKKTDPLNRITTIDRDGNGNQVSITRPNGASATMTYDGNGNLLTRTEQSILATTTMVYEPTFNQVTRITDPEGNQTNIAYDAKGNPTMITDAELNITIFLYNSQGQITEYRDALYPANPATTFTYDSLGRLNTTTDPLGRKTTLTYDQAGNVATSKDPLNRITTFEYDEKNRLRKEINPLGGETIYTYDGDGNLVTLEDAKHQTTTFAYDDLNRLASTSNPLGKIERYEYDANNNLTKRITSNGDQILYSYDPANQLLSKTFPGNQVTNYQYDLFGNLKQIFNPDSVLTMTYDLANRLSTVKTDGSPNQSAVTLTYTYDKNSNRLTLSDGTTNQSYAYNALNHLTSLTSPVGQVAFAYDALSRRTSLTLPNGTQTAYTYDSANQVKSILHQVTATSTQINKADYLYNSVGNRTQLTDRRGTQIFGYDTLDRVTSASHPLLATPQAFAYDGVGNRTTGGTVVNVGNQLTADSNFAYQYDDNGNLSRKTFLATGNFISYTYDAESRLTMVEEFSAGNPTPFATSTYRYDGLGRRIEKVANGQTTRYVYDDEDILLEYDCANVLQARYINGAGIDEAIAITKGGNTFFYHQDGLGTVTDLTDISGVIVRSFSYDSYGNILDQSGNLNQPYSFTGREIDSDTGLYYYRKRHYDADTGRFLQADPIGLTGGVNIYAYTINRPTMFSDPLGLYTSARWVYAPTLSGVTAEHLGEMGFGDYWTIIPPAVGIGGDWWMIRAHISGLVECIDESECGDETRDTFPVNVSLGKRLGLGYGLTTYPLLQWGRKAGEAIKGINDAINVYRNEWTQLAIEMGKDPLTWCIINDVAGGGNP